MSTKTIKIATRKSALALWQANEVARRLQLLDPQLETELIGMTTSGDRFLNTPLATQGGKGLFVKELENSIMEGSADIAVHSMKDVPYQLPDGLIICAILEREDPRDAFVSNHHTSLDALPEGACVGTASMRRELQLTDTRQDLNFKTLRGNVNTRLKKLDDQEYDAIILACAGLIRLGFSSRIRTCLDPTTYIPAIGQGAIGIECREDDQHTQMLLTQLHHAQTAQCVLAERVVSTRLQANCQLPIAAHCWYTDDGFVMNAWIGSPGSQISSIRTTANHREAAKTAEDTLDKLYAQGAREIIDSFDQHTSG